MKRKRLMVVAGGDWQVPIIRKAKAMGLFVINTNLYPDSPGFEYADVGLVADVLDREKQLSFAREYGPDGILTDQSDISVSTVAYLCEQLRLPGIGSDKAELFTNKHKMREFLRHHHFDTPDFRLCSSPQEAEAFARQAGYPVVLKPVANQASRGVFKANSAEELYGFYETTLSFSRGGAILVEQFINGTELTVEGFKTLQKHYSLAISRKKHYDHNPMVASELFYAPGANDIDYERLRCQHNLLVGHMGLRFGITHTEYIHSQGKFYLVEIAARGGGTRISSDIVPAVSGIQINELLISMALGNELELLPEPADHAPYAILSFLSFEAGTVRSIFGLEEARRYPGVIDIGMNIRPGQTLEPPKDDKGRHGYFIVSAGTQATLEAVCDRIRATVKVDYV